MPEFLYVFGYETPEQAKANTAHGWDDEDSEAVFIEAESVGAALDWGRQISEQFIRQLYGIDDASWWRTSFAHWIVERPESEFTPEALSTIPHVPHGRHPIFPGTGNP
jgi:hypothetical protein